MLSLVVGMELPFRNKERRAKTVLNNFNQAKPPERPAKFESLADFNDFFMKLREYYAIIGRPR